MPVPNHFVGQRVGNNRVELVALLGEGSYGCVYRGILHQSEGVQKSCAVKCLSKANLDAYHLMCQRREILLHKQVSDGHGIVTLYESFEDSDYQWIVMEYSSNGDLWEAIADGQFVEKDHRIKEVFSQILAAVEYCHSKHVFHRDLKPENVLLTEGGSKVLLADFGLASGSPMSNELRCGSPWYMSPECWGGIYSTNLPYSTAPNDVWCLGILLINIACGRHAPWRHSTLHDAFFRDYLRQPGMLRLLLPLTPEVHDLLERIFVLIPTERITIRDFRTAFSRIDAITIPTEKRADFHDRQRASWSAALSPTPTHPQSTDIVRIVPVTSPSPVASTRDEGESVDITDAFKPVLRKKKSFIRRIPVIDTRPQTLRAAGSDSSDSSMSAFRNSSSSSISADILWPVTPQMAATQTVAAIDDFEIIDISDTLKDVIAPQPASPFAKLTDASITAFTSPFQNILRAIRAL
ncbi:kinase-like protein [Ramaria rubella]|nr:kinase-like protein [Ramaria rubella]